MKRLRPANDNAPTWFRALYAFLASPLGFCAAVAVACAAVKYFGGFG